MPSAPSLDAVAVNFTLAYYGALAEHPSQLALLYTPQAVVSHAPLAPVSGNGAALQQLLADTHFGGAGVRRVEVRALGSTSSATGAVLVSVSGVLHAASAAGQGEEAAGRAFVQEFELVEIAPATYGIAADTLQFPAQAPVTSWAAETPPMFARAPKERDAEAIPDIKQPPAASRQEPAAVAAPAVEPSATAPAEREPAAATAEPSAAPAEATAPQTQPAEAETPEEEKVPEPAKAPQSFAEALKMKKKPAAGAAKKPAGPLRVMAVRPTSSTAAGAAADKKTRPTADGKAAVPVHTHKAPATASSTTVKKTHPAAADATNGDARRIVHTRPAGGADGASTVVFYDIIIKGLPRNATEKDIHAMLPKDVSVARVKVESKAARSDPTDVHTFAFVKLDAAAIRSSGELKKTVVERIVKEGNAADAEKKVIFEEVREKKKFTPKPKA